MEEPGLPSSFFRAMAAETTRSEDAFIAGCPSSTCQMLGENVDLIKSK